MGFAQNLKYIKKKRNLSNYRIAKLFECSQSSVLNWLENGVIPHTKTRQKIADHFGITLESLDGDELPVLPKEGIKKETSDQKAEGLIPYDDKELNEMIEKLRRMDKKKLRKFSAIASAMLED